MNPRLRLKTYSHLLGDRMPTDYELLSSGLLYYPGRGFEVDVPLGAWYARYQQASAFSAIDWERFRDPRETTYPLYVRRQQKKEAFVDGIFQFIEDTKYDQTLSEGWLDALSRILPPLRYPLHGFQMLAAYIGEMAPSGKITVAAAFQAADEMRRVQRIAYRIAQLKKTRPRFGEDARALWEKGAEWQPLRETIERLFVAYDWGEAFVGLNLCVKPMIDELFTTELAAAAARSGDHRLVEVLYSLNDDCHWHSEWSTALVRMAAGDRPATKEAVDTWTREWAPRADQAAAALAPLLGDPAVVSRLRARQVEEAAKRWRS